ncbi:hypothetical protein T07_14051 [Trichinella nelsoni]|uniref:Uncharacterized protein n=1 Tax=Trichinella nelsoni TaxID=6336 RepID=A0A0V0RC88_9BILA|nr:hypothetical protein T07_14051 [Trichinella nelsoni]
MEYEKKPLQCLSVMRLNRSSSYHSLRLTNNTSLIIT